jgi:hypothetical protein
MTIKILLAFAWYVLLITPLNSTDDSEADDEDKVFWYRLVQLFIFYNLNVCWNLLTTKIPMFKHLVQW